MYIRPHALPPPRPVAWPLKPLESTETGLTVLPGGQLELSIHHEVLRGVTPAMLEWWFHHIEGAMEYCGKIYPRYLVWHPLDHIAYSVRGTAGQGGVFHIVEAFGRNLRYLVDILPEVVQCNASGLTLVEHWCGMEISRLQHRFTAVAEGTQHDSHLVVGISHQRSERLMNQWLRPWLFSNAMGQAWLRHNVEEVGNFERFLPGLYALHAHSHS